MFIVDFVDLSTLLIIRLQITEVCEEMLIRISIKEHRDT